MESKMAYSDFNVQQSKMIWEIYSQNVHVYRIFTKPFFKNGFTEHNDLNYKWTQINLSHLKVFLVRSQLYSEVIRFHHSTELAPNYLVDHKGFLLQSCCIFTY